MAQYKTIAQLEKELAAKKKMLSKLAVSRERMQARLDKIDRQIANINGETTARRGRPAKQVTAAAVAVAGKRGRRRSGVSLVDCIKEVLADSTQPMRVRDIADAATTKGYRSGAKNFYPLVAAALQNEAFKRAGRGLYTNK